MAEPTFEVVFNGELAQGAEQEQVIENLAALFKTSKEKIARLFGGGEVILKSNLDESTAQRYQVTLRKAGAACSIRPRRAVARTSSTDTAATVSQADASPDTAPEAAADPGGSNATDAVAEEKETPAAAPGEMTVDPPGVIIIEPGEKPELQVDTSAYSLAPVGSDVLEGEKPPPPPPPDTGKLSLAPLGADILDKDSKESK